MDYGKYHYNFYRGKQLKGNRLVAIDTEWSKNWKQTEKFTPFLISIYSIYIDNLTDKDIINIDLLDMEIEILFRDDDQTTSEYLLCVDDMIRKYLDDKTTIIGHQLSSDLHTMKQSTNEELMRINFLIDCFKNRKSKLSHSQKVADTRYDIKGRIVGEEKLRTVSLRLGIFAIQNELDKMSLTKMYNNYVIDHSALKREMLITMNWRHAFQTCLVWLVDMYNNKKLYNSRFNQDYIITNDIIAEMGKNEIGYLKSDNFLQTTTTEDIHKYVKKYYPNHPMLDES